MYICNHLNIWNWYSITKSVYTNVIPVSSIGPDHCVTLHTRFWAIAIYLPWNSVGILHLRSDISWKFSMILLLVFPWFCHDTFFFGNRIRQVLHIFRFSRALPWFCHILARVLSSMICHEFPPPFRNGGLRAASGQRHDEHPAADEIAMGWARRMRMLWNPNHGM